jgi:hypothetical protein
MSIIKLTIFFLFILFNSCNTNKKFTKAENALDAGREFIDGCLQGDFEKAQYFMLTDDANNQYLQQEKKSLDQKNAEIKKQLKESSIIINEDAVVNDSIHIINYKNSFDKNPHALKVVLRNKVWQVDLKYTFNGNL